MAFQINVLYKYKPLGIYMIYKKMKKVVRLYEQYWDGAYFEAYYYLRNYLKNNKLSNIRNEDVERSISKFFKIWMKMMRVNWGDPEIIHNIKETIRQLSRHFEKLKIENLEKIEFDKNIENTIKEIFNALKNVEVGGGRLLGSVGTSKIMHIILPELFQMWDGQIIYACGYTNNDAENFIKFMKQMQNEAKELLKSCSKTKEKLCKEFEHHHEIRTLPKLIDEYNFVLTRKGYIKYFKNL